MDGLLTTVNMWSVLVGTLFDQQSQDLEVTFLASDQKRRHTRSVRLVLRSVRLVLVGTDQELHDLKVTIVRGATNPSRRKENNVFKEKASHMDGNNLESNASNALPRLSSKRVTWPRQRACPAWRGTS